MRLELGVRVVFWQSGCAVSVAHAAQSIVIEVVHVVDLHLVKSLFEVKAGNDEKLVVLRAKNIDAVDYEIIDLVGGEIYGE